jgi:hypothetical protein
MSEPDDRIEPRPGMVGTGMLTDPDRIRDVQRDFEVKQRAWRSSPARGFHAVLGQGKAARFREGWGALEIDDDIRGSPPSKSEGEEHEAAQSPGEERGEPDGDDGATAAAPAGTRANDAGKATDSKGQTPPTVARPPDPRAAILARAFPSKKLSRQP